jgi:hypothetical protein
MLTLAATIPLLMLLVAAMINVSTVTSAQTFVNEAALQGARVGIRSADPAATARAAVLSFGEGVSGWRLDDRLGLDVSFARRTLNVEVRYRLEILGGQSRVITGRSSIRTVDMP